MAEEKIVQFFKGQQPFSCANRCYDYAKIAVESIQNIKSDITILYWLIYEGNLIDKGLDSVQVFLDCMISFLNHYEFLL